MKFVTWGRVRDAAAVISSSLLCCSCSFLPGFGLGEAPALYFVPVAEIANKVSCELEEFIFEQENNHRKGGDTNWVLDETASVKVVLTLQTDDQGYVNFTGINASSLGLGSLNSLITTTTQGNIKVPTLAAKVSGKRTKTVAVTFTIAAKKLKTRALAKAKSNFCLGQENPITSLYLRDWLKNYFVTMNAGADRSNVIKIETTSASDAALSIARAISPPPKVPSDLVDIQTVQLTSSILIGADMSAGATPSVLGNGSVFILPINGLGVDYNPDYQHKIDITMNVCDSSKDGCNSLDKSAKLPVWLFNDQCYLYNRLYPLLPSVQRPQPPVDQPNLNCAKNIGVTDSSGKKLAVHTSLDSKAKER